MTTALKHSRGVVADPLSVGYSIVIVMSTMGHVVGRPGTLVQVVISHGPLHCINIRAMYSRLLRAF